MNRLKCIAFAAPLFLCLSGCSNDEEWTWHQKVTVSVVTPSGTKVASSVQRGTLVKYGWWQRQWGYGGAQYVKGESVVLEVAPGRYLFALLSSTPQATSVFIRDEKSPDTAGPALESIRQTRELLPKQYPLLVTFKDVNDPSSVRKVDPASLEASFGPGFRLNSITMTMTDEPITDGLVKRLLPWLSPYPEPKLSPATSRKESIPFSRQLSHGDFIAR